MYSYDTESVYQALKVPVYQRSGLSAAQFVVLQFEDVRVEGLLATGQILLLVESSAVGLQGAQVLHTSLSGGGCLSEARAELQLVGRRRGAALYLLPQVQTVTLVVLRRCRTKILQKKN